MIGYLRGNIKTIKPTEAIIDTGGVGYLVNISINTYDKIMNSGEAELFIYTAVREDSITLYGFSTEEEKEMFEMLISVSGIGPKSAQSILSGIQVEELRDAVREGDISRLVSLPGIGRKTAERLQLELKGKIDETGTASVPGAGPTIRSEAVSALTSLGYNIKTSEKTIREIMEKAPGIKLEELLKEALRKLSG